MPNNTDTEVVVDIDPGKLLDDVARYTDDGIRAIAHEVASRAQRTTEFADKTKALRLSISVRKSKRQLAAYQVVVKAPHAHLIEIGHQKRQRKSGGPVGRVEGRWFLAKARDSVIPDAEKIAQAYLDKLNLVVD